MKTLPILFTYITIQVSKCIILKIHSNLFSAFFDQKKKSNHCLYSTNDTPAYSGINSLGIPLSLERFHSASVGYICRCYEFCTSQLW